MGLALTNPAGAEELTSGGMLFMLHCAACHGEDGRGNGSVAPALKTAPSDLTRLADANAGVFPAAKVIAQIDGRDALVAHGGTMPVYGWFFEGPEASVALPDGSTIKTTEAIKEIVSWLQSQQGS
jgi:mono/diheme cytochrome c family protein